MSYLADNPQVIVNGFRHAGIYRALGLLDESVELSDYNEINVESDYDESDVEDSDYSSSSDDLASSDEANGDSPHLFVEDVFTDSD